jgi:hypothetical protein
MVSTFEGGGCVAFDSTIFAFHYRDHKNLGNEGTTRHLTEFRTTYVPELLPSKAAFCSTTSYFMGYLKALYEL